MATTTTKSKAKKSTIKKPIAQKATTAKGVPRADQYNDPSHNYLRYWDGRDYEHAAEEIAIRRLLGSKTFKNAADIGGGYGRLCLLLRQYADKVTLAEPSQQQLNIAKDFLKGYPDIKRVLTQTEDLKFKDKSLDLITVIRVMHHIPKPEQSFKELARVLSDDGVLILEMANYAHGRNRVKHLLKGQKLPSEPVDIRTKESDIAFVNHNPRTVQRQLAHAGLKVEKVLSVSNLRSPALKKIAPKGVMLVAERILQPTLAKTYFGPSVFFLVKKAK
jgi:ubiquinone/menaquinone biosynthesis C-methylase UbiE